MKGFIYTPLNPNQSKSEPKKEQYRRHTNRSSPSFVTSIIDTSTPRTPSHVTPNGSPPLAAMTAHPQTLTEPLRGLIIKAAVMMTTELCAPSQSHPHKRAHAPRAQLCLEQADTPCNNGHPISHRSMRPHVSDTVPGPSYRGSRLETERANERAESRRFR
ncbi:hypothetical protein BJY01DRAFT_227513 [Aspergillus pseudoustus]|uniref:Uncharacterized protein n=1 Tax=Aspergillus pseudoustus TaxID=1810923 RepID=A0ABR4ITF3_9EURO